MFWRCRVVRRPSERLEPHPAWCATADILRQTIAKAALKSDLGGSARGDVGSSVMSAPDPRSNPLLLGHAAAEATILDSLRAGRLHHAWLITGPTGVGKATLAFRFARRLLAGLPTTDNLFLDPAHPAFRRVAAGGHADLLTIELGVNEKTGRARTQIAVDDVRRIGGFMALTPAEGGWRVVIVDGAEDLNQASANALLKILEEPPARALLLLCCAAPGRLLPTIRSRCRRLRLDPLDDATMAELLGTYRPDLAVDEGSPGRALLLAEEDGLKIAGLVEEVLAALPDLPATRAYALADTLRGEGDFSTFMDLLRTGLAAAVRDAVRGRADSDQARLAALRAPEAWVAVWQELSRVQAETERFALDKRQALVASLGLLAG
jgi:DNA polymerase-3 subunit delta'